MRTLYDDVPYPGRPFAQTHPDRLATIATLLGVQPAPPAACRVLEVGCGDGANLLPIALALPQSAFVGIDLSAEAIEHARATAAALGLGNVRFEQLAIERYEPPAAGFDYVVAHGFYSWVPAAVRDRLLAVCATALSERGVAFVSYNALPGNRTRQTLRELLAYALQSIEDPAQRISEGRALLRHGLQVWPSHDGPPEATLGGQARVLLAQNDAVFFHDTLSPVNAPVHFHEFAAHAGGHGLQFLAEAEFAEVQTGGLPEDVRRRLLEIGDVVRREQLLDFFKQRMFRQTLLCHAALAVDRPVRAERVAPLAVAGHYASADAGRGRMTFTGASGAQVTTEHPLLIEALLRIDERWPGAVWIEELAGGANASDASRAAICEAMVPCFSLGLVSLHVDPPQPARRPGRLPCTTALARLQARERTQITTLRHTSVGLDDELGWRLVELLDGTRDRAALRAELEAATNGAYPDLEGALERSLETLARASLLLPEQ